ncbi:cysteine sulfinic acid decarboxylase [Stomoxys calcitrans]|uniref:cysteine sulfinic acid decarboxylase n=1 Tax=Stomoxys calcitrans TaxID=35570 RepID=UPI0027E26FBD|nr:cysteine sulfinic acid decarboxylase [Stomoxys calcitrans]
MLASENLSGVHHPHHHHLMQHRSYSEDIYKKEDPEPANGKCKPPTQQPTANGNSKKENGTVNGFETNEKRLIVSHPTAKVEDFIHECVEEILKSAVFNGTKRSTKVVEWHSPEELKALFDFKLKSDSESHATLFDLLKKTIGYSVKTGHPYFINQLYSGVDPYALIGQWLTDALNPSVYTYEVAPVFTLMEEEVLSEMRRIVGFQGEGDGIFCPGGSIANGYAISCARYYKHPEFKKSGLFASKRQIIFTSEDAHYSVEKLAMFMGLGSDNVCKIKTNKLGKMDCVDLERNIKKCLQEDCEPMMVSATAGTTVLGAYDEIPKLSELCQTYGMWLHVDAAWGGGALISQKYRHRLRGIEKADSVTWNPHKMLTASQQCSTFLTRHKEILSQCHSTNATYLFQKDKFYDTSYDTGDKHIQCGRRADVFKFWFMWKAKGTNGLEEHVDQLFHMAEYLTEKIRERPGFELVLEQPECTNVSFWYIPPSMRSLERGPEFYDKLHTVAPKCKEGMIKKGSMMVTYQPLHDLPNFFRIVLQNSCLNESDMNYFLDEIERLGSSL